MPPINSFCPKGIPSQINSPLVIINYFLLAIELIYDDENVVKIYVSFNSHVRPMYQ